MGKSLTELIENYETFNKDELTQLVGKLLLTIENMQLQINSMQKMMFGSKRETTPKQENIAEGTQCSLFNDAKGRLDEELEKQIDDNIEELTVYRKKKSKTKQAGIKKGNLKDVELEIQDIDITDDQDCPICHGELKEVSKKVVRQEIKYIPAKLQIVNYIQHVYKCTKCGGKDSENTGFAFVKSKVPKPLLTHSFASPSLATEVIYQKYYLGVPLYRQEKMWDDKGLVLPRNMMANWNIKITEYYLEPLYELMLKKLKAESELLHCDESTIQCNKEPGKKASSKSYMWVLASGALEKQKGIIYKYSPSRSAKTAKEFLEGYKGILVTDGYTSYDSIEGITHSECWAHARRYFYESIPLDEHKKMITSCYGYEGLQYCNRLFKVEEEIANFSVEEKQKERLERSKPILDEFFAWVKTTLETKTVINDKLKKALIYANNQQKELSEFIKDGRIPLTNSLVERAIRPFAVHRKNWLFADSVAGAKASGILYSLIESAKLNNLNIEKYINYLLEQLPQLEILQEQDIEKYLPWSKELPPEILNYQGDYKEMKIEEEK